MDPDKLNFLVAEFPAKLATLNAAASGSWGRMNAQQMVEHFTESVLIASGRTPMQLFTPADRLDKMREFLFSEAPFKENTRNPLLTDEPAPPRLPDMSIAISQLRSALEDFQQAFATNPEKEIINPFFGPLNFSQQVHFLHKHAQHHARQFGLI